MENTKPTPVTNKGSNNKLLVLAALIALFIATLAYGYYQTKNSKSSPAINSSEWAEFKSEKYGFKLDYLKSWGEPHASEVAGSKGKTYTINFVDKKASNSIPSTTKTFSIVFDTDDMVRKVCNTDGSGPCGEVLAVTRKLIEGRLKADKSGVLNYDDSSFSNLTNAPPMNLSTSLSVFQIVEMDKINVSAARGTYSIYAKDKVCPTDKFSATSNKECVSENTYTQVKEALKSLKTL